MNTRNSNFFRLLQSDIDSKGNHLREQISIFNQGQIGSETFVADPTDFAAVPGSPFAYWSNDRVFRLFRKLSHLESSRFHVYSGTSTGNDFRFLRIYWEVEESKIGEQKRWINFPKGGHFSKFYSDPHLVIDWTDNGAQVAERGYIRNSSVYFHAGLTYPPRTQKGLNFRVLPAGCVISHKGPAILAKDDNELDLFTLLSITNTSVFEKLVKMQMAFGSFEIGVIQNTPLPIYSKKDQTYLIGIANKAYELARQPSLADECTHVLQLPTLLLTFSQSDLLPTRLLAAQATEVKRQSELAMEQNKIDSFVSELYGVPELVQADSGQWINGEGEFNNDEEIDDVVEGEVSDDHILDPALLIADLLMWCIGVTFGRWDVRFALEPSLLPELQEPFDPLPVCSPGALVGSDGLPAKSNGIVSDTWLRARPNVINLPENFQGQATIPDSEYPLNIAWQGILVDDPTHPRDIITAVRQVIQFISGDQAAAIEAEACQILGFDTLRDWFRDPKKGFYNFHIKRYSKSRRKAPIYWLLQSAKRNSGIWLYYHRLTKDTYFLAGRDYVDAKFKLEEYRLSEMRQAAASKSGSDLKTHEKAIAAQVDLVEEIKAFGKALDDAAFLELKPDLNDGVVLNIAPLREITPWSEARKYWNELIKGKFAWSTISQQLLKKGHRKG